MPPDASAPLGYQPPLASRDRPSLWLLGFAVFGAPIAWAIQHLMDYSVSSYRCYPSDVPRIQPLAPGDWAWMTALALIAAALVVILAALTASVLLYRRSADRPEEASRPPRIGEGRTRFLALCGILVGIGFFAASAFDAIALFVVPLCRG